jgi:hypothetical protein
VDFTSANQRRLFLAVVRELEGIGYGAEEERLQKNYRYPDWFAQGTPEREVPAATFAHTPCSYSSACLAVVLANGDRGSGLVNTCRALGSPLAFEVHDDFVSEWTVAADPSETKERRKIRQDELRSVFRQNRAIWSGQSVLRAKNIGFSPAPIQRDLFVDAGLLPALEEQVSVRLDHFLKQTLAEAQEVYVKDIGRKPDEAQFFRLMFRFVAAKVLRDRGVGIFPSLDRANPRQILREVEAYYRDNRPTIEHLPTLEVISSRLWNQISFANLSVEVLAYIYEHTFVGEVDRRALGIHSTPYSLARYITYRLPIEDIPEEERFILEPCCGHGVFLVAALHRLRETMKKRRSPEERHNYFVERLRGFDLDPFALEVARLCLMLSDFPNRDGWKVQREDVFSSRQVTNAIAHSRIVLCNPPFEAFSAKEQGRYRHLPSPYKSVALLRRVLEHLPGKGLLGFVLPRMFLDGRSYAGIRQQIIERFAEIETVALPDKVFRISGVESALLICKQPSREVRKARVAYTHVEDSQLQQFLRNPASLAIRIAEKTSYEAKRTLKVLALGNVWSHLRDFPKLKNQIAIIHRGIEWLAPFDREKYISPVPKPGFKRGVALAKGMKALELPHQEYLDMRPESRRREEAFTLAWNKPKAVIPKARLSRGPWCLAAFADEVGLVCYQNFIALWPCGAWTAKSLAAILNSPVASAYVATRSDKLDIREETVESIPLPRVGQEDRDAIESCVDKYLKAIEENISANDEAAKEALLDLDAAVLRCYNLPPPIERELLNFFRGQKRPLPFEFSDYVEVMITKRLEEQTRLLEEDEDDQRRTWDFLEKALDEDRLSHRKLFR